MTAIDAQPEPVIAKPQRFHGFDALRGGAMLLGIVLHAAITYMVKPMDGLLWPLSDQPSHVSFDALFWWIHGWRIPLFFVMAGFFAAMLARRRGPGGFIQHRIDRILKPVIVASVVLLPIMYCLWGWGWLIEGLARWEEVYQFDFDNPEIEDHFIGPAHLWFLNYLMIFSAVYWLILKLRNSTPEDKEPTLGKAGTFLFNSVLRPVWFAVPTAAMLYWNHGFYSAYHHVVPLSLEQLGNEVLQMIYQGYFFATGVYLFRLHREMDAIKRYAWLYLSLAQIVFVVGSMMISTQVDDPYATAEEPAYRIGLAASIALFCWLMIWGMTGLGLTLLAKPQAVVRWLSDSAYWVYLVHLPIVALLMIVMRNWPIIPWGKFLLIVAVTSVLTLASYQWGVRYTIIGTWLNGPRAKADHAKTPSRQDAK